MRKLSASNIVSFINQLDKNRAYNYIHTSTKSLISIDGVDLPEGPIRIKRWNPNKEESAEGKKVLSISVEMIWRVANCFEEGKPINLDRALGGSYNTRSVLESLMAYTPEFYFCYPGRIEDKGGLSRVVRGHKHLLWLPQSPHVSGKLLETKTDIVISEIPSVEILYDSLELPTTLSNPELDISIQRRHAQIQIALYFIGKQLNFRTWIAQNDRGILYQNKKIAEYDGIIASLKEEKLMIAWKEAARAALMIDCIWFKNGKLMPAVMEVEHSTGVTSGLSRMKNFKDKFISLADTRYVIVAPDETRNKVIKEASKLQFRDLNCKYFPYSAVEELYALCLSRKLKGVTEEFLDCYMEPILEM